MKVWVVCYKVNWDADEDPVFTVFDNEEAATKHFRYIVSTFPAWASISEECPIYSKFETEDIYGGTSSN